MWIEINLQEQEIKHKYSVNKCKLYCKCIVGFYAVKNDSPQLKQVEWPVLLDCTVCILLLRLFNIYQIY